MGKKRRSNAIMVFLTTLIAAGVVAVTAFPFLSLREGSLAYAILSPLNSLADRYVGFFATESLSSFGLFPLAGLCLVNVVMAIMGSGFFAFLLRCVFFYGAYLVSAWIQGSAAFAVPAVLPAFYPIAAAALALLSATALFLIARAKNKKNKASGEPALQAEDETSDVQNPMEAVTDALNSEADADEPQPQPIKAPYVRDEHKSRKALSSLTDVVVPEFNSFQNYSVGTMTSSVDRANYEAAAREAQIRKEEQEKREAELERQRQLLEEQRRREREIEEERARREAEENRARLENMFKPRTLMKRLNEDAQAEKVFPTFGADLSSVDFGISASKPSQPEPAPAPVVKDTPVEPVSVEPTPVQFVQSNHQEVSVEIPVSQQIPVSQRMQSPYSFQSTAPAQEAPRSSVSQFGARGFSAFQPEPTPEPVIEPVAERPFEPEPEKLVAESVPQAVFKEAAAQAEMEEQLIARRRQAELEKKHLEELQILERQRREAEAAAAKAEAELAAMKAQLELAAAKTEMQRQLAAQQEELRRQEEARRAEEARLEAERKAEEERQAEQARLEEQRRQEEFRRREEEERKAEEARRTEEERKAKIASDEEMPDSETPAVEKVKGPDVDYVSGVAGTKNAASGNSYLIDKQKFEYKFPPESLLKHYPISSRVYEDLENDPEGQIIVETLKQFKIETSLIGVQHGPTFTLYELSLAKGVKVTAVLGLADNLAMELSVDAVRILAPIPGKPAIGVEVPNKKRDTIGFDVMMPALTGKYYKIPMVLGRTITGDSIVIDLAKTPHLLVAGTTGSGKSVCINGLICSVLFTKTPKDVRMILVDPKMVELSLYNGIPHLLTPVITDAKKALKAMNFVVEEMERRMALFSSIGAKKIEEYNEKIVEKKLLRVKLPYIMVIIDEFADLMLAVGKELETSIKRITAVARFCGIHLVLATQRPSSDVITGVIKSNIPTQIAFAVSNSLNSRIIIDSVGAEKLLGRGDMLYNSPEARTPSRIQGAYIDSEIEEIVSFVKTQGEPDYIDESYFEDDEEEEEEEEEDPEASQGGGAGEDMFSRAWKIVSDRGEASASYLQRRLNIGYNRAANLIEQMEDAGYIGPARGSKPREILKLYGSD